MLDIVGARPVERRATHGGNGGAAAPQRRDRPDVLSDALDGGAGDDRLTAGPDADDLVAGDGNDVIDARNGVEDSVDCGPGDDPAIADDREDGVLDCESVQSP